MAQGWHRNSQTEAIKKLTVIEKLRVSWNIYHLTTKPLGASTYQRFRFEISTGKSKVQTWVGWIEEWE
jgi:hypothetical protein